MRCQGKYLATVLRASIFPEKEGDQLSGFLPEIQFVFVLFSLTLHRLVPGLGSCACATTQSPISATDQQRHQVSTGQVAQATSIQDGASWTTTWWLFVYLKMYPSLTSQITKLTGVTTVTVFSRSNTSRSIYKSQMSSLSIVFFVIRNPDKTPNLALDRFHPQSQVYFLENTYCKGDDT